MSRKKLIRDAVAADADAVAGLLLAAGLPLNGLREGFGPNYAALMVDGEVTGAAGIELYGDGALLRSVVVRADLRGMGGGRDLVLNRLRWAQGRGVQCVYLLTTTAERYFHRLGFRTVARNQVPETLRNSIEFRSACPQSATVMRLNLKNGPRTNPARKRRIA